MARGSIRPLSELVEHRSDRKQGGFSEKQKCQLSAARSLLGWTNLLGVITDLTNNDRR